MLETCTNLISLLKSCTPKISSPFAVDFPNLDLKKLSNLDFNPPMLPLLKDVKEDLVKLFAKEGFFNLISFSLPKIFASLPLASSVCVGSTFSSKGVDVVCAWGATSLVWFGSVETDETGFVTSSTEVWDWTVSGWLWFSVFLGSYL